MRGLLSSLAIAGVAALAMPASTAHAAATGTVLPYRVPPGGIVTVGWPVGAVLIVGSWLLTGIYIRRANGEFDALNEEILREARK